MSTTKRSALGLVQTADGQSSSWALVGEAALRTSRAACITTQDLEALPVDPTTAAPYVEKLMSALETFSSHHTATPGGASWLYVQHVPVRRLISQLVRKLLALSAWQEFAVSPGPITPAPYEGLIGLRDSSSREYRAYTVTWSGVAYALGDPAPHNPVRSARLRSLAAVEQVGDSGGLLAVPALPDAEVLALSWSSRHAETLTPVLEALSDSGHPSVLADLATHPVERPGETNSPSIKLCRAPAGVIERSGTIPETSARPGSADVFIHVAGHAVRLGHLERLAAALLELSAGCSQPSWHAVVGMESWLDELLAKVDPGTVLLSNDTSPVGALAVHAAERHGATTVLVQHGAWIPATVAWPALHSRHIVVMGNRDVALARTWARHPEAKVHVLGQPRFDGLAGLDRESQHRYLRTLLAVGDEQSPERILVWACQPFGPERLKAQAELILAGIREAEARWGLVIAPHPAQEAGALAHLIPQDQNLRLAVADPSIGARGCLAGTDALVSTSSTCGIEAILLDVPVLELAGPGDHTLGLAEEGAAQECRTAADITTALNALADASPQVSRQARDAVCHWSGSSAADIARLIADRPPASPDDHDAEGTEHGRPKDEGVTVR